MNHIKIPDILKKMNEIFAQHGYKAYLVGGAVQDMLMGKEPHDWDVTTDATPEQVMSIFRKVIPTGIAHGTVTVHFMKNEIEVTTFRTESDYSDGRHPDKVEYTGNIEEDLSRRDFTINAIASYLGDGTIGSRSPRVRSTSASRSWSRCGRGISPMASSTAMEPGR